MELSNVLLFWKQWREAPETGIPSFPISSTEMSDNFSTVSSKLIFLYVWNFILWYPHMSLFQHIGFISIGFTNWDLWSFSQGDLLQFYSEQRSCTECHVSLVHILSLIFGPPKFQSVPFMEHLQEFHLDLCSSRYCRSPQMSCLGMNSGRGWNPNLERSYLLEYSESESDVWTQDSSGFYICPLQFSASETLSTSEYNDCTKTY